MLAEATTNKAYGTMPDHSAFLMSLDKVGALLRSGVDYFKLGDEIWSTNAVLDEPIRWVVVDLKTDETERRMMTLWALQGFGRRAFDKPTKERPYGRNVWRDCTLRKWLNGDALQGFTEAEREYIAPTVKTTWVSDEEPEATTADYLWLPSLSEIGYGSYEDTQEGEIFQLFRVLNNGSDYGNAALDYIAQTGPQIVRLRSALRGNTANAWVVTTSGGVYYGLARNAYGAAPACIIR